MLEKGKKLRPLWRGLTAAMASLLTVSSVGYGIADRWRSQVDDALGTQSYVTNSANEKYVSDYTNAEDLMNAAKALAVREGAEGTVIMKNDNNVLPLSKTATVSLFGGASYRPYMSAAGNSDQVNLIKALTDAGLTINSTLSGIYDQLFTQTTDVMIDYGSSQFPSTITKYAPNTSAGDYLEEFQIKEANPSIFETEGGASSNWKSQVHSDIAICTFMRPGGESSTYRPGSATDNDGNHTGKSPLDLSDDEMAVIAAAKETCDKVIVLLNTSCTIEIGELTSGGSHEVDGIAYIGIPNDYQFTGVVQALCGDVNPTGALADTYATDTMSSPAMMNFGGGYFADYETVADFEDTRWPGVDVSNTVSASFGGVVTYSGGWFMAQAEGIYTGYNYYETRYYDSIMNPSYNANSAKGVYASSNNSWNYDDEVSYSFGWGLSYLPYTQRLTSVEVENRAGGEITATVDITNNGDKSGLFLAQLYVQTPYTQYDRTNRVEKSAIQFLTSGKVEVGSHQTQTVTLTIPTKYIASYDSNNAQTYILDGGTYYFATGRGAHEALNNIIYVQDSTKGVEGNRNCVYSVELGDEGQVDNTTYAVSDSGTRIANVANNADLNYYLPGTVTYLSRQDWDATYPINYNELGLRISDSPKKDEWLKELRNQQHVIATDEPVQNVNGVAKDTAKFDPELITYEILSDINNDFWEDLVQAIPMDSALGAINHGGNRTDVLPNIDNPIVVQNDGPTGFGSGQLSGNNLENPDEDPYYADPESEAGRFSTAINSQTLLGSCFNPDLAYDWGRLLGNSGLWIRRYFIWGAGLNYHRTPYNGRNVEYLSEDPMLTNIIGAAQTKGSLEMGIISGPKHIGFNDQEYDRTGVSAYMNEQKMRETDLRGFQGAIEDENALAMMIAFNRIGAINASHHVGMIKGIFRNEWDFKGAISTDASANNQYYFNPEGCIMATVTMMADFAPDDSTLGGQGGTNQIWTYFNYDNVINDNTLVEQARQNLKYHFYAFANSAVLNISTTRVTPWWESALKAVIGITAAFTALAGAAWIVFEVLPSKKEEN